MLLQTVLRKYRLRDSRPRCRCDWSRLKCIPHFSRPATCLTFLSQPMAPAGGAFARRGGKVHSSQRTLSPPLSGKRGGGLGLGKGIAIRRKIKVPKDNIFGITKGDIRRLARRGGVKRISAGVYETARHALHVFLKEVSPPPFPPYPHWCSKFGGRSCEIVYCMLNMGSEKPLWCMISSTP